VASPTLLRLAYRDEHRPSAKIPSDEVHPGRRTGLSKGRIYLRVARLIDGVGPTALDDAAISIDSSRIAWVGKASELRDSDSDPEWYDCGPNSTALPGLVDVHTHFTLLADGRSYEDMAAESDELLAMAAVRNAGTHLRSGVTTARDNGARNRLGFALKGAIDHGVIEGPRLLVSGRPVTPTRGHFHWCNGTADGEVEIRQAIRQLVGEGADHIKIMASGGGTAGTDPGRASYEVAELKVAVETAHTLGRLTTAHCRAAEGMARAIEADVDCMEHGEFLTTEGEMVFDEGLARRLVDSGMYLSPTLQSNGSDTLVRLEQKEKSDGLTHGEKQLLAAVRAEISQRLDHFNRLISLGLGPRMLCGTDAGCFDYSFGHMDYGLSLMVAGGMSPMEAILSATRIAAEACGVADEVGSLAPGKQADVLVVHGNPLDDISVIAWPLLVMKAGRPVGGWPGEVLGGRQAREPFADQEAASVATH
jgi:imidazolonepropionase-like amidohydrolase